MVTQAKTFVLKTFQFGTRIISITLASYLVLFFVVMGLSHVKNVDTYPALKVFISAEKAVEVPAVALIRKNLPYQFKGTDFAPWMFIFALFVLWIMAEVHKSRLLYYGELLAQEKKVRSRNKALAAERKERLKVQKDSITRLEREANARAERAAQERAQREADQAAQKKAYDQMKRQAEAQKSSQSPAQSPPSPMLAEAAKDLKAGGITGGHSREELMEMMAQAKKQLESQKRNVSFLSIDVVNSTGMKIGEDPAIAERDFRQYKKVVEKAIADNKGLKAAWTPDGVMICFPCADTAVGAAKQVISDLGPFNRDVKAMRMDFKVRCGVNAGEVLFDQATPMEEMSDRSIDIAGHMQKYAGVNSIYIGKHVIEGMKAAEGFSPVGKKVDDCDVYEWRCSAN